MEFIDKFNNRLVLKESVYFEVVLNYLAEYHLPPPVSSCVYFHFQVVLWLLEDFVMVLLRTHFYVTEGLAQRNRLLFYRTRVHQRMTDCALSLLVESKKLRVLDKESAAKVEKTETFPGKAVMWFIPKKSGVRPVLMIRCC